MNTSRKREKIYFAGLNVTVTVIEKFRLSGQYNPQNFLETYRSSMELELRSYNMLEYNMFRQAQISFPGENDLHMILPDSVIAREKSGILIEYLQKVFCERCGMDLKVELEFRETQESKYRKNAAVQIAQEVENVIRHAKLNSKNEEPAQSEEAGTAEKKAEKKTGDIRSDQVIDYSYGIGSDDNLYITYELKQPGEVFLTLFDLQGRQLTTIQRSNQSTGNYRETISMNGYPKGEYILRITVGKKVYAEKIIRG